MSVLDVVESETEAGIAPVATEAEQGYRKRKLGVLFWLSVAWLGFLVFGAVLADLLPLKDPTETFRGVARTGPSADHWFGADNIGHDVFSRAIYGARRSLFVATVATLFGLVIGGTLGLIAGYYRRALDGTIAAVFNVFLAVPGLIFLLSIITFLAPPGESSPTTQTIWTTLTLSILTVPIIGRITRVQTMVWADRDFVMASRTLGARNMRIMLKEILPNVVPILISYAFIVGSGLIIIEAVLAFFGVGDVTGVSWGLMIQNGRSELERSPHMVLFPALFIFLTVLALNFIGDQVLARFAIREGGI